MKQIIECVPNFSEGSNDETIEAIAKAIKSVEGVKLLHQDSGKAANRTVYTFAGEASAVFQAAYRSIKVATEKIDMKKQKGEHPRIGACDVCPFVAISGITQKELIELTNVFAKKIANDFNLPIFLYEKNATSPKRKNLANHRIGGYEKLKHRIEKGIWKPDYGNYNSIFGGCVTGVRNFLVAYNINLNTANSKIAQEIAYDLRELGRPIGKENGKTQYLEGQLKHVKAIGWYIKDFNRAQVSINLTDYKKTPLHMVFEHCKQIALSYGVKVTGSELIGLLPKNCLESAGAFYLENVNNPSSMDKINAAIQHLGLGELKKFTAEKRIIEFALKK